MDGQKNKSVVIIGCLLLGILFAAAHNLFLHSNTENYVIYLDQDISVSKDGRAAPSPEYEIPQNQFKMKLIEEAIPKTVEKSSKLHKKPDDYSADQYNLTPRELKMVLDRFKNRISNLRSTCTDFSKDISARNGLALTVEEQNFIACASWKCSSTYWKRFADSLRNSTKDRAEIEATRTKMEIVKSDDAIKVLIVRHPFVRLISSWNEKYSREHKHANHYYKTSKGLIDHYDHDNWHKNSSSTHLVSFKDFIYWLALNDQSKNPHFAPQTKMCKPCQNFNFLIKVETMSEDSKAMFQSKNFTLPDGWVLNEPQRSFNGGFGTAGIKKIIDHTRKLFQNVPVKIIKLLMEKFNQDFYHYGYTFDTETMTPGGFD